MMRTRCFDEKNDDDGDYLKYMYMGKKVVLAIGACLGARGPKPSSNTIYRYMIIKVIKDLI